MNFSWLSLIGGGFAAAATLTAGISMTGLLTPATPPAVLATDAPVAETIYVEQPVIEVPTMTVTTTPAALPPLVIAILPPEVATNTSTPTGAPATGGGTQAPASRPGGSAPTPTTTPGSETPAPTPLPSFPNIGEGDDGVGGDDGDYYEGEGDGDYEGEGEGGGDND